MGIRLIRDVRERAEEYLTQRGYDAAHWTLYVKRPATLGNMLAVERGEPLPPLTWPPSIRAVADIISQCDYALRAWDADPIAGTKDMPLWCFMLGELVYAARVHAAMDGSPLSMPTGTDSSAIGLARAAIFVAREEVKRRVRRELGAAKSTKETLAKRNADRDKHIREEFESLSAKWRASGSDRLTLEGFARDLARRRMWQKWNTAALSSKQLGRIVGGTGQRKKR